jgi:hypothetical protein
VTVDFVRGWGEGVSLLLDALQRQKVPRPAGEPVIDPNWEIFRLRGAIPLVEEAERLTSNWLRLPKRPTSSDFSRALARSRKDCSTARSRLSPIHARNRLRDHHLRGAV